MRQTGEGTILGLIGGVGAGKSTVLSLLEQEYGFYVIQTDLAARKLMEPGREGWQEAVRLFGRQILNENGEINRPVMAEQMFRDPEKRRQLDNLTHPLVWKAVFEEARQQNGPVVIETALPSKEFRDKCEEMWYLYTSREVRKLRLRESRGYSEEKTEQILNSQPSEEAYREQADHVIDNSGSEEETKLQIDRLLRRLDDRETEG